MNKLLEAFLEAADYRIDGGQEFMWHCWQGARFIDVSNELASASIVIDVIKDIVYQMEVHPEDDSIKPYRWTNPDYIKDYQDEGKSRNVDDSFAWEGMQWANTDSSGDLIDKIYAIFHDEEFDPRVVMELNLDSDLYNQLVVAAAMRNMNLNDFIVEILTLAVAEIEKNEVDLRE